MCDPTYVKCPEQANPQRQRVDCWLSGAVEGVGVTADGHWFSFGGMECSGTRGDGYIAL